MRMIDADAMYQRYCVKAIGLDGIYDTTDLPEMLKEMPTIDAIPVKWFFKMIHACGTQGQINAVAAMNWVLEEWKATKDEWQKEQEAQECSGI